MAEMYNDQQASTPDWRHVIRHEIGHAYFSWLLRTNAKKAMRVRDNLARYWLLSVERSIQVENTLSLLAIKDVDDLIAEAFAVYLSGVRDNEVANDVVKAFFGKGL